MEALGLLNYYKILIIVDNFMHFLKLSTAFSWVWKYLGMDEPHNLLKYINKLQ